VSRSRALVTARGAALQRKFRREVRRGLIVVLLFFGGFGGWAALAPLASAVVAPGVVVVSGDRQAVQHRDGGIVRRILVHEGQRVAAGDILLELDDTEIRAQRDALTTRYISLAALRSRLDTERRGLDRLAEPAEFADLEESDRVAAAAAMDAQRDRFESRQGSLENDGEVLEQRIEQLRAQIGGLEAQEHSQELQIELLEEELEGTRTLNERGLTPTTRVRALERGVAEAEGRRAELEASVLGAREQIGETELQIVQLRRARDDEVMAELAETDLAFSELRPQREALMAQLERTRVRAPATGQIVGLKVRTEAGVIAPGEVLMEVVPEDRPLVVQARINPNDIDALRTGARAQIRLTAFPQSVAPLLYGAVSQVSADRMIEETTGAPYYLAEAVIDPAELERIDAIREGGAALRAGMPAEVVIPIRSRTALQYLVEPLSARLWRSFHEG
jgi:HlyD family type I secretion membrane fusion protein